MKRNILLALIVCLLPLLMLAGCDDTPSVPGFSEKQPARTPGVTDTEIRLGSSLALTGHASFLGKQTLRGAMSYLRRINEEGGVHGRQIVLDARDDGYDPPRCLANTQQFLIGGEVFALFCYVGTPTTVRILPLVEEAGIPLLGMFTGANALRQPFNPWVINVRASYYEETRAAVQYLVKDLGLERIAVFYQYDAYGFDGLTGTELALREMGLAPIARGSYMRGTVNIEEGFKRIFAADAQAVVMVGTYEPCAEFIRRAQRAGMNAIFHNLSFVGGEELARLLGDDVKAPVMLSQVVPPFGTAPYQPVQGIAAEYVRDLATYYPDEPPNSVGLEGYVNARVLVEGLRRAGKKLTREGFVNAIEGMGKYELGESVVSFGPRDHQGLDKVYFSILRNGQFEQIVDFSALRKQWENAFIDAVQAAPSSSHVVDEGTN